MTRFWIKTLVMLCMAASMTMGSALQAKQIHLDVAMSNPTMLVGKDGEKTKSDNYLRIGLTGFDLPSEKARMSVNVAIVIDKSGSMQGDKIEQARKAAIQAVERLRDDDIVSIITYDSSVDVIVPATKASDRESVIQKIRNITADGNTALFAGVSKGAAETRKFLDDKRVNRVILLSDGLANVGPSTPSELEQLGESLIKEGISVSTMGLGLGYNEDLMSRLALASSGNHVFIEDAENLVQVFQNEFDDVLSVVAQKIVIRAKLADGIRPVKVLNYPADVTGQQVTIDLGQLYSQQERYFVVEVEVKHGSHNATAPIADVSVEYVNMTTQTTDKLSSSVEVKFSNDEAIVNHDIDKSILSSCVIQIANERNRDATRLRDEGKVDEAKKLLLQNADFLGRYYAICATDELQARCVTNGLQAEKLADKDWLSNRKNMVELQYGDSVQQSYRGTGEKVLGNMNGKPKSESGK